MFYVTPVLKNAKTTAKDFLGQISLRDPVQETPDVHWYIKDSKKCCGANDPIKLFSRQKGLHCPWAITVQSLWSGPG